MPIHAKGYCTKHYQRIKNTGKLELKEKLEGCVVANCNKPIKGHGYCSKHYYRMRRHSTIEVSRIIGDDCARLKSHIKIDDNGCWIWQASITSFGYGRTSLGGRLTQAHRASWAVFKGEIPLGMQVNHKCHVRSCINPEHLYIGTQVDNMRDMRLAKRKVVKLGSENATAKLNEGQVMQIRKLLESKKYASSIALQFNVSESAIFAIKRGKTWKHLK